MRVRLYLFTFAMMSLAAVTQTGPDDRVVHLMQELTEAPSPSGEEGAVRAILKGRSSTAAHVRSWPTIKQR
jgi:hypothetical protein